MPRALLITLLCGIALCALPGAASAQPREPQTPTITVIATGTAEYVPDIARITLGIRSDEPTAVSAVDTVNKAASQVIAAVKALGIAEKNIKTTGYNLQRREPLPFPSPNASSGAESAKIGPYQAWELLQITAPIKKAGSVLDAAITAGANESLGVTYALNNADALYKAALAKAMLSARDTAQAIATASHVSIIGIDSVSNVQEGGVGLGRVPVSANIGTANVLPGTDVVTATVSVVYRIR